MNSKNTAAYFKYNVFQVTDDNFNDFAIELFRYQARENKIYKDYLEALKINVQSIDHYEHIPFLPISFFKTHRVVCGKDEDEQKVFKSSGTTKSIRSNHYVLDEHFYKKSTIEIFEKFYGHPSEFDFLALLPSYLEQRDSSLVYMVDGFISESNSENSSFYKDDLNSLFELVIKLNRLNKPVLLIGVAYALLDFCSKFDFPPLNNFIIMETGGMKGRRRELTREELHDKLEKGFKVDNIHSEYGMTELFSQAYASSQGRFEVPSWMKVITREINDPFKLIKEETGCLNILDLANIDSCAFIATDDLGKVYPDGSFTVLGRLDNSDVRGCSLMIS